MITIYLLCYLVISDDIECKFDSSEDHADFDLLGLLRHRRRDNYYRGINNIYRPWGLSTVVIDGVRRTYLRCAYPIIALLNQFWFREFYDLALDLSIDHYLLSPGATSTSWMYQIL